MEDNKLNVTFEQELSELLNKYGIDNALNMADYVVASYRADNLTIMIKANRKNKMHQQLHSTNELQNLRKKV